MIEDLSSRRQNFLSLLLAPPIVAALYFVSRQNYLLFHGIAEMFAVAVAIAIFMLAWNARRLLDDSFLLFLGIAYLFVGFLDLLHTLAYQGMGVFPDTGGNLATQLWIAARYLEASSLVVVPLFLRRRANPTFLFILFGAVVLMLLTSIFYWRVFPDCYIEETGLTPFKKNSEYAICALLALSMVLLFRKRRALDPGVLALLMAAILTTILAELVFTLYAKTTDVFNMTGHLLKVFSFYLIYQAVIAIGVSNPYRLLFRDLKRSETAFRESETRLRQIAEASFDYILMLDLDFRVQFINRGQPEVPAESLIGASFETLVEESARREIRELLEQVVRTGESRRCETRHQNPEGGFEDFESIAAPIETDGKIVGIAVTARNITQRKQTEKTSREREALLQAFFENTAIGIVIATPEARYLKVNKRCLEMFGYDSEEELFQSDIFERTHATDRPAAHEARQKLLSGEIESFHIEKRYFRKNGEAFWGKTSVVPIKDDEGKTRAFAAIITDITAQKEAEAEKRRMDAHLRQSQKLDSLRVMAGSIAHNFNNMLMAIGGYTELALVELPLGSPIRNYLEEIEKATRRATEMSTLMLTYVGQGREARNPIRLSQQVETVLEDFLKKLPGHIACIPSLAREKETILGDPRQIQQLVQHLLANALEAIESSKGTIFVATRVQAPEKNRKPDFRFPHEPPEGKSVILEIADTGCGMDDEVLAKAFDPFYTTKFPGRGLGLAAVFGIAQSHHGVIHVESKLGKGTTVRVAFPVGEASAVSTPAASRSPKKKGVPLVLIADDEETVRRAGEKILTRSGFRVLAAADGIEAVERFRRHADEIACVLLDLTMPGMDGVQALAEIHKIRADVPVIVSSGFSEREMEARFAGKNFFATLQKPYDAEELLTKLRLAIG